MRILGVTLNASNVVLGIGNLLWDGNLQLSIEYESKCLSAVTGVRRMPV